MRRSLPLTLIILVPHLGACNGDDGTTAGSTGGSATTTATTITGTGTGTGTDTGTATQGSGTDSMGETIGTTGSTSGSTSASASATDTATSTTDGTTTMGVTMSGTDTDATTGTTGPSCENTCSMDGTQVVCGDMVVQECNDGDQYCEAGMCKDTPCEAAKKAQSSQGCEFWSVKTGLITEANGACFAAFVANPGDQPVHIEVEYDGQTLPVAGFTRIPSGQGANIQYDPYDANTGLPAGEVAILFLSRGAGGFPTCPQGLAAVTQETAVNNTGRGKAFRISTDLPVAAYQMLPYGGGSVAATSATLLLPTTTWDANYVAIDAYQKSQAVAAANPLFTMVADEDDTQVTIDPKVAIVGGPGVNAGPAGVPITYTLMRGETIQIAQPQELTGSPMLANKPFGLFGGASCLNVPTNAFACDGAHQQIPPVKALGFDYTAVRYRNRTAQEETPPWRIVGAVDGTQLTWVNKPAGAPDVITLGGIYEFNSAGPFQVKAQDEMHPFYLAGYMTGGSNYGGTGDPEWVNVIPSAQYLKKYVLFTDPTYSETSLVVVRTPVDGAFADVNLGCAGNLTGWMPVGDKEYTRVNLVTGNFMDVGACSNGRHEMTSDNPFGVTVWGWGSSATQGFFTQYVSYAYPAGASIKPINDVMIIPQ
ncbi:MAG TPA: IgGFc-binding protein [Nannocystaceae bacterium]|nr:IgGFc-binding protein [Nannocystaceae bacterium]